MNATFELPVIDYRLLAPLLIILIAGTLSVLVEAFLPRGGRRPTQLVLVFGSLVAAIASMAWTCAGLVKFPAGDGWGATTANGSIAVDGPALMAMGTILVIAILGAALMAERSLDPSGDAFAARASALPGSEDEKEFSARGYFQTEIWPLFLFSVSGMLLFVTSNGLLLMFVALEVMSLPLYLLAGMARRRRLLSQEAGLKYFLLGAFSSAFFLYGMALIYGYTGSVQLPAIADALTGKTAEGALFLGGLALLLVGLLFKVAAAPFHQWSPDVYQGAPTPVTGFMAATVKIAAFGALMRVLYVAFGGVRWDWQPLVIGVAILSILVGSITAITQTDIKRMLAYSAIAQAGFILVGVSVANPTGVASALFYVITYAFSTIGAFAIVMMVRNENGEASHLSQWAGLGRKSPVVASVFALFMLSLTGIPFTSGFIAKFAVFEAALGANEVGLVIVAVIGSLISAFFYMRVVVVMFFSAPSANTASVSIPSVFTTIALAAGATVTLVLGVFPQPLLDLVASNNVFVR